MNRGKKRKEKRLSLIAYDALCGAVNAPGVDDRCPTQGRDLRTPPSPGAAGDWHMNLTALQSGHVHKRGLTPDSFARKAHHAFRYACSCCSLALGDVRSEGARKHIDCPFRTARPNDLPTAFGGRALGNRVDCGRLSDFLQPRVTLPICS